MDMGRKWIIGLMVFYGSSSTYSIWRLVMDLISLVLDILIV